jgi:hypothetical protein
VLPRPRGRAGRPRNRLHYSAAATTVGPALIGAAVLIKESFSAAGIVTVAGLFPARPGLTIATGLAARPRREEGTLRLTARCARTRRRGGDDGCPRPRLAQAGCRQRLVRADAGNPLPRLPSARRRALAARRPHGRHAGHAHSGDPPGAESGPVTRRARLGLFVVGVLGLAALPAWALPGSGTSGTTRDPTAMWSIGQSSATATSQAPSPRWSSTTGAA